MRDEFIGDIGDYGKYALLNALADENLTLAINWYFNYGRGKAFDYLTEPQKSSYGDCYSKLYSALKDIVGMAPNRLKVVESKRILPEKTIFNTEPLDMPSRPQDQMERRKNWHSRALQKTENAEIIFLDPGIGLAPKDSKPNNNKAVKYVFVEEIVSYTKRKKSVILYHHLNRNKSHLKQVEEIRRRLSDASGMKTWAIRFGAVIPRVYIIIPRERHRDTLAKRLLAFASGKCREPLQLKTYGLDTNG